MTTNQSPWMMKTEILQLLDSQQVWEMSDKNLEMVKQELLRMCRKCNNEIALRAISEGRDTPIFEEVYGG